MTKMVPAVSVRTVTSRSTQSGFGTTARLPGTGILRDRERQAEGLEDGEEEGQVARVVVELAAAQLALVGQAVEHGEHVRALQQAHDDRGVDVGHHAHREDGEPAQGAARERVQEPEQVARLRVEDGLDRVGVDSRDRDGRADAEDGQGAEHVPIRCRSADFESFRNSFITSRATLGLAAGLLELAFAVAENACADTDSSRFRSPSPRILPARRPLTRPWICAGPRG